MSTISAKFREWMVGGGGGGGGVGRLKVRHVCNFICQECRSQQA